MNIKTLVSEAHRIAKAKGWWEKQESPLHYHALIHSEVSEATEESRNGTPPVYFNTPTGVITSEDLGGSMNLRIGEIPQKPEGELIELADAVIRIADYCGSKGWDLDAAIKAKMDYNETRSYKHGGKKF